MFFFPKKVDFFQSLKDLHSSIMAMAVLFEELTKTFGNFETFAKKAEDIEHEADKKAHGIVKKLNQTFITPIDREDIYFLANELDDIVDLTENAINNIRIYKITQNHPAFGEFAFLIKQAAGLLGELLEHLQTGKNTESLTQVKVRIHELEDRADSVFEKAIEDLFRDESNAVNIIKFKDVLENLESVMDKFQKTADAIEGIMVKSN